MENVNDPTLDPGDAAIVFADLQTGIVNVGVTNDPQRLHAGVAALADLATIFALPVVVSCVATTSGAVAPLLPEITSRLPDAKPLVRTTANPMADAPFRSALGRLGRKTIVIAGVATEVVVRLAALAALRDGFRPIVIVDACGGLHPRTESATFAFLCAAGVELSSVATLAAQLAGDFGSEQGKAAMRVLQSTLTLPVHGHDHEATDSSQN